MGNGLVIIHHTAPIVGQFNLFGGFGGLIYAAEIAVNSGGGIASIANGGNQVT